MRVIAGSAKGAEHLEPRLWALMEEGTPELESDTERRWRTEYQDELDEFWKLNESLTWSYARAAVWAFKKAGLSESEQHVMRLVLAGDDDLTIAKALRRQNRTIKTIRERAEEKLEEMPAATRLAGARPEGSARDQFCGPVVSLLVGGTAPSSHPTSSQRFTHPSSRSAES
jgi:DNA-binding CsgD family transcriptional regulator